MFESISWQEYLSVITLLIVGYYLVITLLLFSSEIANIFKQRQFGTSTGETNQYQSESNDTDDLMGKVRYETHEQQNVPREEKIEVDQLAFSANEVAEETIEVFDELEDSRKKSIQNITEEVDALTQIVSGNNKEEVVSLFQSLLSRHTPAALVVDLSGDHHIPETHPPLIFQTDMTESDMKNYAANIVEQKRNIRFIKAGRHKMRLALHGIYIKRDMIFYHFRMINNSNINYDVDFLRFYIQDQKKAKRTASQEVDVQPVYVYGQDEMVPGKSSVDVVYALEKFTIPEAKHLIVEMFEKNGGRNLNRFIKNRTIVNAQLID